jgi:hypothetical protein
MSAQPTDHYPGMSYENVGFPQPGAGVLRGVHEGRVRRLEEEKGQLSEVEREQRNEEQRQLLLHDFYDYCKDKYDVDPRTEDTTLEHDVALIIQGYAFSRVNTRLENIRKKQLEDPEYSAPEIKLLSGIKVNERTNRYYERFGEDRRFRSTQLAEEEKAFFDSAKVRATAIVYNRDRRDEMNPFLNRPDGRKGVPRHAQHPEIRIVMELQKALGADKSFVAAKAAEVTFAIYGSIFPANIQEEQLYAENAHAGTTRRVVSAAELANGLPPGELPDKIVSRQRLSKERRADLDGEIEEQE